MNVDEMCPIVEGEALGNVWAQSLPDVHDRNEPVSISQLDLASLCYDALVRRRFQYQTVQAAKGVRVKANPKLLERDETLGASSVKPPASERESLRIRLNGIIQEHVRTERGVGTGLEREHRWRQPARGGRDGVVNGIIVEGPAAGTAANAAAVAAQTAKKVSLHCLDSLEPWGTGQLRDLCL